MTSNQPIFDAIVNFFTQDNWSFTQIKKQSTLRLAFKGKNGKCDCYAQVREKEKQFIFYSVCPTQVPKTKRRVVGEFLLRINHEKVIGGFDLDFNNGEIRYKTSISFNNKSLTSDTIKDLVYTNLMMMERYLPGIRLVISGFISPEEALAETENLAE
ncbi:YbjN domain-containing protein [Limnofasciculus baicalensis]|uniref:YbjN domain-containing protein n=1 Tax=Limnofasciculus baicalensis BBK-W-15 TaxID=2699891 RepID=A0AAE3GPL1_9CYAN|nr:YbjN domain-containing protein [Limnofasciculus baicalensis]MCP2727809.1 YbjN domain-containing protein [Limnofasciculus baicalensis BBK-W-15]